MKQLILTISLLSIALISCKTSSEKETSIELKDIVKPSDTVDNWNKEKWFKVEYQQLCDEVKGITLDFSKVKKYGQNKPYDMTLTFNKDTAFISFEFISDCCLKFSGEVINKNDTLFLCYGLSEELSNPCDCYCDYKMNYKIDTVGKHWNSISIKNGRLK